MGTKKKKNSGSPSRAGSLVADSKKAPYPKSDIRVNVKDHCGSRVYTSSSPVTGDVTITTRREVPFDSVQILLLGQTRTSFDGVAVPQTITHTFLKMVMPVPDSAYPAPRVLRPGRTYTFPFHFVVPSQLTIGACNHDRLSDQVHDHHLLLPPSLGGGLGGGGGRWQRDDMAPSTVEVEYSVKARVVRDDVVSAGDGGGVVRKRTRIMEASQAIQVLPATAEQPPLSVTADDRLYRMARAKTVRRRRGLFATRLGRLTAEAAQPSAAVLSPDGRRLMAHPVARLRLTFEPDGPHALPPAVTGVSARLAAHTFFSSGTIPCFPNLGEWNVPCSAARRAHFSASVALPTISLAEPPAWTWGSPMSSQSSSSPPSSPPSRRSDDNDNNANEAETETEADTEPSHPHSPSPSASPSARAKPPHSQSPNNARTTTTTTLTLPLTLPTDKKTFVPTFHSCLASRVYALHLTVHTASASAPLSLVVPLQVAVAGGERGEEDGDVEGGGEGRQQQEGGGGEEEEEEEEEGGGGDVESEHTAAAAAASVSSSSSSSSSSQPPSFDEVVAADEYLRPRLLRAPTPAASSSSSSSSSGSGSGLGSLREARQQQQQQMFRAGGFDAVVRRGWANEALPKYADVGWRR